MPRDERPQEPRRLGVPEIVELLSDGRLEVLGRLPNASNSTLLARVSNGNDHVLAVYKPQAGEAPLWDFPEGTLCLREVAAFEIGRALGWPAVPTTVLRDGPDGPGSVQLFVEFDPDEHYFTLQGRRGEDFRRIALFDAVVNNADRKGGHCLLGSDGRIWVIDHGVCFGVRPKLRTVIWEYAGEPIAPAMLAGLDALAASIESGPLRDALAALLTPEELQATVARARALTDSRVFPSPGASRHFPWPPV